MTQVTAVIAEDELPQREDTSKLHRPGERDSRRRARWGRTAVAQLAWPGRQVAGEQRLPASLQGHVMQR
jgi:hypothetical protein